MIIPYSGPGPQIATEGAAAFDLRAELESELIVFPGMSKLVPTGMKLALPPTHCALVLPRSGLAANHQVTVLNAPGLIDSDYRGEIKVCLYNAHMDRPFTVEPGMRIAQLMLNPFIQPTQVMWFQVDDIERDYATVRGAGGFGSTGV